MVMVFVVCASLFLVAPTRDFDGEARWAGRSRNRLCFGGPAGVAPVPAPLCAYFWWQWSLCFPLYIYICIYSPVSVTSRGRDSYRLGVARRPFPHCVPSRGGCSLVVVAMRRVGGRVRLLQRRAMKVVEPF